ncbi:GH12 family glycosyl hydrolase domain-containing protein [Actinokineospora sp. UTMC 2448]|uniref:GH12 family glycosyl hydrolase domain-containing protein n=1 Tax=Actinokineospora sp. UTMC 2448 TaxID=2268449 RepID=UPI0021644D70|nr:cellulose binding domain-containing protein [Actinokineospora sp. UTMC 2448]UVS78794.1 Endoglucanase S precursor [Actinokineospora sp. UTMC 2448]
MNLKHALGALGAAGMLVGLLVAVSPPEAAAATTICEKYGSTSIQGGRYIVQNNEWGDDAGQCISVGDTGFRITSGHHDVPTNGAPAGYPSIYAGCHYGNCSTNSGLPLQVSRMGAVSSSVSYSTADGYWNAAYDLWFDPNPNQSGQNTGAELMIWGNHQGPPQPIGSRVGTANLAGATWDVWYGNIGWNVISYVRQQTTNSLNINVTEFTNDAVRRGHVQSSWYLTSVQFGFEPWRGGPGLAVNSFSFSASGGSPTTTTTTPGTGGPGGCRATHRITNSWSGGFTAEATITNTGSSPAQNWRAGWTVPSGVSVTNGWNATFAQSGTQVTAAAPGWSTTLNPGQSVTVGYQATGNSSGSFGGFTLNGAACA